ncbi:MAG: cobalamin-binding protein [Sulfuricella sp.]|nr:cobalamin-binding protein [Sulfuricella sp.]
MRTIGRLAAALIALLLASASAAAPISAVDDAGRTVALFAPAQRILSLAPHVTELVFAAGAGARLAGVTSFSDYPAAAKSLPLVGDYGKIDAERILALKPDLVIGWRSGNSAADVAALERLGIPVFLTEPRRLEDIPRLIETIGELAGTRREAAAAAAGFRAEAAELRRRYGGRRPVRVFYEIWHDPLLTINGAHLIGDVIGLCGGRNLFSSAASLTPAVSVEDVLAGNPEAIVASHSLQGWRTYPRLAAVRRGSLFFIDPDLIQRQTPRILTGARRMCEQIERAR